MSRNRTTTHLSECLHELGTALEAGDVTAALSILDRARAVLSAEPGPSARRLGLVGGVRLTDREAATLCCLPDGSMSQKDIARALDVTPNTVKTHLKAIYQKLGAHCRGEAIHRARELGLLPATGPSTVPADRDTGSPVGYLHRVSA